MSMLRNRVPDLTARALVSASVAGVLLLGGRLLSTAASESQGALERPADPKHAITISGGPKLRDVPFSESYEWTFRVEPPLEVASIREVVGQDGRLLPPDASRGGLNGGVGTLYLDVACLRAEGEVCTVTFVVDDVPHEVEVATPRDKSGAFVDVDSGSSMWSDFEAYVVRVLDRDGGPTKKYSGTAWVTAFTLKGSRVRLNRTAGTAARIDLVDGVGSVSVYLQERVKGDGLILQVEAPGLYTTRSSVWL